MRTACHRDFEAKKNERASRRSTRKRGRKEGGWVLAALLVTAASTACLPTAEVDLTGEATWNERLRADLQPLSPVQVANPPYVFDALGRAYYSDGSGDGSEIVSEVSHSLIAPQRLREMRSSECLWVGGDGFPMLSFEAIVTGFESSGRANLDTIGLCGGYPSDPVTREVLSIDGSNSAFGVSLDGLSVAVNAYTGNDVAGNPYAECDGARPPGAPETLLGEGLAIGEPGTYLPFCSIRSGLGMPDEDTSYSIEVVDLDGSYPGLGTRVRDLSPELKVVRRTRVIARPLEFRRTRFSDSDQVFVHDWIWRVDTIDEGGEPDDMGFRWRENYAPSVLVEKVRVFVQTTNGPAPLGSSGRSYVPVRAIRTLEEGEAGGPQRVDPFRSGCSTDEAGDPDGNGSVYLGPCGITATPTYALVPDLNGRMTEKLEWRVQFETLTENELPPAIPGDALFIEFHLSSPTLGSQTGSLLLEPGAVDLGEQDTSRPQTDVGSMEISSVGVGASIVESISIEGAHAAEFSYAIPSGIDPPFVLPPGTSELVDVRTRIVGTGDRQAELVVRYADTAGEAGEARVALYAEGVSPELHVLPSSLSLRRGVGYSSSSYWRRAFLVANFGGAPLDRDSFRVSGAGASHFRLVSSDCGGKTTSPPARGCRLDPGESELVYVDYVPQGAGHVRATVIVETHFGDEQVSLFGTCYDGCYSTAVGSPTVDVKLKTPTKASPTPSKTLGTTTPEVTLKTTTSAVPTVNLGTAPRTTFSLKR